MCLQSETLPTKVTSFTNFEYLPPLRLNIKTTDFANFNTDFAIFRICLS